MNYDLPPRVTDSKIRTIEMILTIDDMLNKYTAYSSFVRPQNDALLFDHFPFFQREYYAKQILRNDHSYIYFKWKSYRYQ